jgi:formylglycine-generating enzyme required for sulfatase activity
MSPEQADGRLDELDFRTDVYALGAILYEMLTLHPPFEGKNVYEVLARVREGRVTPPSSRVENLSSTKREPAQPPSTRPAAEPVPPELDAICLKALSLRREDRHGSAKELHDEIQAFLEGASERERRQKESKEHMDSGSRWFTRYRELQAEIHGQSRVVAGLVESLKPEEGTDHKRPLWEAEARLRALRVDRINAFSNASAEFARALTADPGSAAAADLNCDLFYHRHVESERRRDPEEALRSLNSLAQFDLKGHYRARLKEPGRLTIRTFARACRCLNPADHPEWKAVFSQACVIPWRNGRARPDLPMAANDLPVPGIRILPQGLKWGHGPECARKAVAGIPVTVARMETVDKRMTLGAKKSLGTTPVENAELAPGSYMCFLQTSKHAPLRLPVVVARGEPAVHEMNVYRVDEVPDGYVYVPGGPFTYGGEWAGGGQDEIRRTEDVFVARFPVTCQQYLEYLNELCAQGRLEEARKHQPHDRSSRLWVEEAGRFAIPRPSERSMLKWNPQMPVVGVSWFDALAFCQWRSDKEKRLVHLLHEEEYEKACRGMDGRAWSWGDEYDPSFSMTNRSFRSADRVGPVQISLYPVDESPCGIRGLSGNVMTWCCNALAADKVDWRPLRGGAWSLPPDESRSGSRHWTNAAHDRTIDVGFRTVIRPIVGWGG